MNNATVNTPNMPSGEYMYISVEYLDPELLVVGYAYVRFSRSVLFLRELYPFTLLPVSFFMLTTNRKKILNNIEPDFIG